MLNPLMQNLVRRIEPNGAVCELGSQTWVKPDGTQASAEEFYRAVGWTDYTALDISDKWNARVIDLNEAIPDDLRGKFRLVTNNGTAEHLFNQGAVFHNVHDLCATGGVMLHVLPWTGWLNHGFYNYQPVLFHDLAVANGYEIAALYAGERDGRLERLDGIAGLDPFHHPKPHREPVTPIERVVRDFGDRGNVFLCAILRKTTDDAFRVPIQGKYADLKDVPIEEAMRLVLPEGAAVRTDPFPHVIVENALPPDLYEALSQAWPDWTEIAGEETDPDIGNTLHQMPAVKVIGNPAIAPIWRRFFMAHTSPEWYGRLMQVFETHAADLLRNLPPQIRVGVRGSGDFDALLDCQFAVNTPAKQISRVRGPHVDSPDEIIAGMLYMPVSGDDAGGELYLYRDDDPVIHGKAEIPDSRAKPIVAIGYAPNTAIFFVNTIDAIHGVGPRKPTDKPRRYINFVLNANKPVREELPRDGSLSQADLRKAHRRDWRPYASMQEAAAKLAAELDERRDYPGLPADMEEWNR